LKQARLAQVIQDYREGAKAAKEFKSYGLLPEQRAPTKNGSNAA